MHRAVFPGYAYQVFAPPESHVNIHGNALHLWGRADGKPILPEFGDMGTIRCVDMKSAGAPMIFLRPTITAGIGYHLRAFCIRSILSDHGADLWRINEMNAAVIENVVWISTSVIDLVCGPIV